MLFKKLNHTKIAGLFFALLISTTSCTSFRNYVHNYYIFGEIIEINDKNITFCSGNQNKIRVGQIVNVKKYIEYSQRRYKKINVGVAQITELVNDVNAKAVLLYGTIDKECFLDI